MKRKFKKIFTNWRVIIALIFVVFALYSIYPNPWAEGVAIRSVAVNSSAAIAGIESPKPTSQPMSKEVILSMNNVKISNIADYHEFIADLKPNRTVTIRTNRDTYKITIKEAYAITVLNETEFKTVIDEVFDEETNTTNNITTKVEVPKTEKEYIGVEDIGLSVYDAPTNNIRKGLDLQGGTRVLLQPEEKLSKEEMDILLENMKTRLNVYGLSDIVVRKAGDLSGNQYVLVEIGGAKEEEVKELLAKQGKFEATIGNDTVFKGGDDITYVCRSADCSGIDPYYGCGSSGQGQWSCRFRFSIALSPEAAQRQADLTKNLEVIQENGEDYLTEKLVLYLDNAQVDELNIGSDLKGRAVTDIQISGSGVGTTEQEARFNSLENMKKLQTILITGSLPVKLNVVKTDNISPIFGKELLRNSLFIGLVALISVSLVIFIRYRQISLVIPIIFTSLIELLIILGFAALMKQNVDLATIAGIIISIGTGVNDQIVITDEALRGAKVVEIYNWKERLANAFFIIMGAYFTLLAAMLPLMFAGAGLLRGFAIASIVGLSAGVFITRPAYGKVIEILLKK